MTMFFGKHFTTDGRLFHRDGKTLFCHVMGGTRDLLDLAALVVKPGWLETEGEWSPPNTAFFKQMLADYEVWAERNLKPVTSAIAIRIARWIVVLYRNDSAYFARLGWIAMAVMHHPEYSLERVTEEYLKVEKRPDRIQRYRSAAEFLVKKYRGSSWVRMSVDWAMEYLQEHRDDFNWRVPASPGSEYSAYDPRAWPGNVPSGWDEVNGGRG